MNLGIALDAEGDLTAALASYEQAILVDPTYAAAHYNLGLSQLKLNHNSEAEASCRAALRFKKPFPEAWVGLASALEGRGQDEEALAALDCAIAERGDFVGALFNASLLAHKLGRFAAAVDYDRRALEVEPEHGFAHYRVGAHLQQLERWSEAEVSYRAALALDPQSLDAQLGLASVLFVLDRKTEALNLLVDAVERHPANPQARRRLGTALRGLVPNPVGQRERNVLLMLCLSDDVPIENVMAAIIGVLTTAEGFRRLHDCARSGDDPLAERDPEVQGFLHDPLLLAALPRMKLTNPELEKVLTHLRACIIERVEPTSDWQALEAVVPVDFICALAVQCHFSGYAFFASDHEEEKATILRKAAENALTDGKSPRSVEPMLAVIAMYDYLDGLKGSEGLLEGQNAEWSSVFVPIAEEHFENRRREREIAKHIPAITAIDDSTSLQVQDQYEKNPYPVWAGGFDRFCPDTIRNLSLRLRPDRPILDHPRPASALVAGCGTGKHPLTVAQMLPECEILAVDLSLTSLAYAARMTQRFNVTNITYCQADILRLSELNKRFTLIDCGGVLHHLNDPLRGWRVLVDLLEPDGLMKISLYSWRARSGVRAASEFLRSRQLPRTPAGIRRGRRAINDLPEGHPAKAVLVLSDFFTLNGCRDLLMHVQEHQFTLPRIAECLDELGLRFLGMEVPADTKRRFGEMFGNDGAAVDLEAWDQFEEKYPSTFINMYSFWCCKNEF